MDDALEGDVTMLRRAGIALGSLVAATLCVGLLASVLLSLFGLNASTTEGQAQLPGGIVLTVITIVLGGLIYRDILRRDRQAG